MKVGSLVECIDSIDYESRYSTYLHTFKVARRMGYVFPKKGSIYTIREIIEDDPKELPSVLLEEIVNPIVAAGFEIGFDIKDFRELQPPMDLTVLMDEVQKVTV